MDLSEPKSSSGRSLRPRAPKDERERSLNTDILFNCLEESSIEDVYLQANTKISEFKPTALETIYESPKGKNQSLRDCMGVVKLKRQCRFSPNYNPSKCKLKLRKNKSKNLKRIGVKIPTGLNVTLEQVEKALQDISKDENEENSQLLSVTNSINTSNLDLESAETIHCDEILGTNCKNDIHSISSGLVKIKVEHGIQSQTIFHAAAAATAAAAAAATAAATDNCTDKEPEIKFISNFEEDLYLESVDTSPCKLIVDKSKRKRRQSRRIQPLCANSQYNELPSLHIDTKENSTEVVLKESKYGNPKDQNINTDKPTLLIPCSEPYQNSITENKTSYEMEVKNMHLQSLEAHNARADIPISKSNIGIPDYSEGAPVLSEISSFLMESISKGNKPRKVKQKVRRTSGINRSLYRNILSTPSPESQTSDEISPINSVSPCCSETSFNNKLVSPSSLFEQLKIHSPEPLKQGIMNKTLRKSARLSVGGGHACLGSLWTENSGSENEHLKLDEHIVQSSSDAPLLLNVVIQPPNKADQQVFEVCSQPPISTAVNNEKERMNPSLDNPNKKGHLMNDLDHVFMGNSPILSGIIDCKARLHRERGFIVQKGSKLKLKHFTTDLS